MRLLIPILFLCFGLNAQPNNIKLKTQLQRCLDDFGDPIENCFIFTNSQGKAIYHTAEDAAEVLFDYIMAESESAVDSIYVSNDSLVVVYFDAPTLRYKSSGLNGIFAASNNNKTIAVTNTILPASFWSIGNGVSGANSFSCLFNTAFRQLQINSSTGQLEPLRVTSSIGVSGSGRVYRLQNLGGDFFIADATAPLTPFRIGVLAPSGSMYIKPTGKVSLGGYGSGYSLDSNPTNFAGWDATGEFQKFDIADIVDEVESEISFQYSTSEQATNELWINGDTIYVKTFSWGSGISGTVELTDFAPEDIGVLVRSSTINYKSAINDFWYLTTGNPVPQTIPQQNYRVNLGANISEHHITVYYTKP